MAKSLYSYEDSEDEYIDMEVGSCINFYNGSLCSPTSPREFEFHMSSNSLMSKDSTTSPADELFYRGKLLPLHLPPRLQMVEKILQSSYRTDASEDIFAPSSLTAFNTPTATSTPFESCNISPSDSFRRELDQEDYMFQYANAMRDYDTKKDQSVAKKTKYSLLGLNLKASKAFLKSLFRKSGCSHDFSAAAFTSTHEGPKDASSNACKRMAKKTTPLGQIQKVNICQTSAEAIGSFGDKDTRNVGRHRRSISRANKHHLITKPISSSSASSSSSSSSDSIGFQELPLSKKGSSDFEISIKGAIAHCKQSQQTSLQEQSSVKSNGLFHQLEHDRIPD